MKQTIKIKYFTDKIDKLAYIGGKSDWIDLESSWPSNGRSHQILCQQPWLGLWDRDYYRHLDRAVNHLATWFVPIMEGNLPI